MKEIRVKIEVENKMKAGILRRLSDRYHVVETDSPDFAFFDAASMNRCYAYQCVRILLLGENCRPDFNLFDYACGFDDFQFGDRYLYYPLFCWDPYRENSRRAICKHTYEKSFFENKDKFCSFVVSNGGNVHSFREEFFHLLNNRKKVDSAGRYLNNMPGGWNVPSGSMYDFMKTYRFALAFENSSYRGYTTEKIMRAFEAGCIPIYWGDPWAKQMFNDAAYVNVSDYESPEEAVETILKIEGDEELRLKMMQTPILKEGSSIPKMLEDAYFNDFLYHILDQSPREALRRTNCDAGWGYHYENSSKIKQEMLEDGFLMMQYRIKRKIRQICKRQG